MTGLIEPINTRLTDARYFLSSPHDGKSMFGSSQIKKQILSRARSLYTAATILGKVANDNIKLQMVSGRSPSVFFFLCQLGKRPDFMLAGCFPLANYGWEPDAKHAAISAAAG